MVLGAGDVRKDGVFVAFLHQAHGDARHRRFDRHARIHQREAPAAHGGHGRRPVRFQDVGDHADRIGESLLPGYDGEERAFGQVAVPDFAPSGTPQESDLAHAEGRKVVVQHEALEGLPLEHVQTLHVLRRAQRGRN